MRNKPIIVNKPWGRELIWANTEKYVGKILTIKSGEKLSRQYHKIKDETIFVLYGILSLEVGQNPVKKLTLREKETFRVIPGTIHRFCAEHGDVDLIEVSTPELDDVVRLEDEYNRN
tara:strand:- start:412 stop:762 length:351 start_codon:yes stop_codon:yes gene_type:complete